ncbi:lycopene cyclase family protein [Amycolatopsis suaedae]|uniref:Lycopene cyclase n=1 Tax=Amycolatopsis suaedae TaxID=2510978 RepID=A0A4Q7JEY6_9PSEU|nr:lycopene cyclase family protein [Amycolatopsis suaedae]RZQ65712.1 lycopene cyclase [Amycolatopsis suaedae]
MTDVIVAGAGPAGVALAGACARLGLATTLVDPAPRRPWPATYGLWRDEVPDLPASAVAAASRDVVATAVTTHRLDGEYLIADNAGLRRWLSHPEIRFVTGRLAGAEAGPAGVTVTLADGRRLAAAAAFDATGARRAARNQTAYGLPVADAAALTGGHDVVFMDWHPGPRPDGLATPTFLYAVPLGEGRVLVEETDLAGAPGLAPAVLAGRLRARLTAAGIAAAGPPERVRIPLDLPATTRGAAVPFGAAAGLVHPATGYSLATTLRLAPAVAAAVAADPGAARTAAARVIWPPAARAVHALRRHGLAALTALPPRRVPEFFELFFTLPAPLRHAYTGGRDDLPGTARAMAALFGASPWRLRAGLALPVRPGRRSRTRTP